MEHLLEQQLNMNTEMNFKKWFEITSKYRNGIHSHWLCTIILISNKKHLCEKV